MRTIKGIEDAIMCPDDYTFEYARNINNLEYFRCLKGNTYQDMDEKCQFYSTIAENGDTIVHIFFRKWNVYDVYIRRCGPAYVTYQVMTKKCKDTLFDSKRSVKYHKEKVNDLINCLISDDLHLCDLREVDLIKEAQEYAKWIKGTFKRL